MKIFAASYGIYKGCYQDKLIYPIQCGTVLMDSVHIKLKDSYHNNISKKNALYNELTAIYAVWKNKELHEDFIGFCHYRRYFIKANFLSVLFLKILWRMPGLLAIKKKIYVFFLSKTSDFLMANIINLDAILPKKILLKETLEEHYKKHHIAEHYDIMIKVISNNFNYLSLYAEKYSKEKTGYFFNMFILNSKYFEVMSSELFRFCGIIEENIGEVKSKKEERYVGYLCERFINFYLHYLIEEKKIKYMELDVLFVNSESFYGI